MSRHARLLATILALAPAAAHADPAHEPPKLAILAGSGVRAEWHRGDMDDSKFRMLSSLAATIACRLSPHFALGIHANATWSGGQMHSSDENLSWSVISVDPALAMQYERDRFTVTPWLGSRLSRYHEDVTLCFARPVKECTTSHVTDWPHGFTLYGLTASFLPVQRMPLAVFLVLQASVGRTAYDTRGVDRFDYSAVSLGLAYQR